MTRSRETAPRFLNLFAIRFPVGAIASIGHRISGVLLLVALPLAAQALERSLRSEAEFRALLALRASPWVSIAIAVIAWAIAHHLLAGIRHLLMDLGVGHRLATARASAWFVNVAASVVALAILVACLWSGVAS
ncbi:MAG TPA: succinate dehydrogenase, cytochrome b556 subunit [Burkholderiaceae bacterium]|nr:succinate dehydrogenase, cytochrome b556 subunit [Burkholderiaceae bacterium]